MLRFVKVVQLGLGVHSLDLGGNREGGDRKLLSAKDKKDRKSVGSTKLKEPQAHQSLQLHVDLIYI